MPRPELNLLWLYPDTLHLHGDRGNIPALKHVGALMGVQVNVLRADDINTPLDLAGADMLYIPAGELKVMPRIIAALQAARAGLDAFLARGGLVYASGSSGAVLSRELRRLDGAVHVGLGLLPIRCHEREAVYGDDLWFRLPDGLEVIGCQIQVMDTYLEQANAYLGEVIYGQGNAGDSTEGARLGRVLFSNCLGPLLVKNPRFAARLIKEALTEYDAAANPRRALGLGAEAGLRADDLELEDASAVLIRRFIQGKMKPADSG